MGPGRGSLRERLPAADLPLVALVTYVVALLAWLAVVDRWLPMPGGGAAPTMQLADPGAPEAMALSNGVAGAGLYLAMWGVMMVAMMYPSSVPLFRLYHRTITGASRAGRVARLGAFMGTYVAVWTLTGLVPLAVNAVVPLATVADRHAALLLGGTLLLVAGYQVSPYKHRCLRRCRTPLSFLMSHHRPGVRGAVRTSAAFGGVCVGCCWALFALMVVVGSMNLVWMALVTVVLSLERAVTWGEHVARGTGVVAGVAGVALVASAVV